MDFVSQIYGDRRCKRLLLFPGYEDSPQQPQPGESQLELTTRRSSGYHGGHGPEDGPEMDPGGGGGSAPPPTDLTLVKRGHHQPQPMHQPPADVARGEGVQEEEEEDYPPFPKRHRALVKQVTLMQTCPISIQ